MEKTTQLTVVVDNMIQLTVAVDNIKQLTVVVNNITQLTVVVGNVQRIPLRFLRQSKVREISGCANEGGPQEEMRMECRDTPPIFRLKRRRRRRRNSN